MKTGGHLKLKLCLCVVLYTVVEYADSRISNFAIEYLREKEKVSDTGFACSFGVQVETFQQNNG